MTLAIVQACEKWEVPSVQPDGGCKATLTPEAFSQDAFAVAAGPTTYAQFVEQVDRCVRALLAGPSIAAEMESEQAQLRGWLQRKTSVLDDGTPIDFTLFDEAILSIQERVPCSEARAQERLLRAARRLAESVYAKHSAEVTATT